MYIKRINESSIHRSISSWSSSPLRIGSRVARASEAAAQLAGVGDDGLGPALDLLLELLRVQLLERARLHLELQTREAPVEAGTLRARATAADDGVLRWPGQSLLS